LACKLVGRLDTAERDKALAGGGSWRDIGPTPHHSNPEGNKERRLFQTAIIIFFALTVSPLRIHLLAFRIRESFCDDLFADISPFRSAEIEKR